MPNCMKWYIGLYACIKDRYSCAGYSSLWDSAMPNAFVAGRSKRHASVVLTTGLIDLLEDEETEAVLAYELTHINIKNSSIGIVTFSWILAGMLIALVYFAFRDAIFTGFGQKDNPHHSH